METHAQVGLDSLCIPKYTAEANPTLTLEEGMPTNRTLQRLAVALAIVTSLILIWLSLGVGLIGRDGARANALYFGVVGVGLVGGVLARLRPAGMARTLVAMAAVQAAIGLVALVAGLGVPYDSPAKTIALNGFFVAMFAGTAWLFHRAAGAPAAPVAA